MLDNSLNSPTFLKVLNLKNHNLFIIIVWIYQLPTFFTLKNAYFHGTLGIFSYVQGSSALPSHLVCPPPLIDKRGGTSPRASPPLATGLYVGKEQMVNTNKWPYNKW